MSNVIALPGVEPQEPDAEAIFRPARPSDFDKFPIPNRPTMRAWVVEKGGEILGVGGIFYERKWGKVIAFSEFDPRLGTQERARGARKVMEIVSQVDCHVYCRAGPFETAPALLKKLGFEPFEDSDWFIYTPPILRRPN